MALRLQRSRLGVAIAEALVSQGAVLLTGDEAEVTARGPELLTGLDIDLDAFRRRGRRLLCRPCLDWSERRPHLAGVLGLALLERLLALGWIERVEGGRAIRITASGAPELRDRFGYAPQCIPPVRG